MPPCAEWSGLPLYLGGLGAVRRDLTGRRRQTLAAAADHHSKDDTGAVAAAAGGGICRSSSCAEKATSISAALCPCWNAAADVQLHPMAVLCSIFSSGRHYACTESSPRHFGARVYESTNAIVAVQLRSALTVRMPKVVYFDSFQRRCARRTELISWLLICGSQKHHRISRSPRLNGCCLLSFASQT